MTKYVNVDGLNFRTGPGTSYTIITVLKKGQAVEVLQDGIVNYVGMYLGNDTMIHASSSAKQVVITTISDYYIKRFVNGRRILK